MKPHNIILTENGSLPLKVEHVNSDHIKREVMSSVKLGKRTNYNLSDMRVDLFRAAVPTCTAVKPNTCAKLQPVRREG